MASDPFLTHAHAAIAAHKAGNHTKKVHHIGHMLKLGMASKKGVATSAAPVSDPSLTSGPSSMGADAQALDSAPTAGVSTPAPMQPSSHYFGQVGPKPSPKPAPHTAPANQAGAFGATNHTPSGGFNKSRFAALKGR